MLFDDYRDLRGQYTKLVSIEMIEAVGHEHYAEYFAMCSRLLKDGGLMLLQAITIADQRYAQARRSVDFIQRYIFPGGSLPSITVISDLVTRMTDMNILHMEDIGGRSFIHAKKFCRNCGLANKICAVPILRSINPPSQ